MENINSKALILMLVFGISFLFLVQFTTSLDSLGTTKVNELFEFCQVCSDASYITLSSIQSPSSEIFIGTNMSSYGSGLFCYNYTPTELGRFDFKGISDGCTNTFATYVEVTPDGFSGTLGFYFLILILSLGIIVLGVSLDDATITLLGSFGLYFIGIYVLFNGIAGFKDPIYTWGLGIITLGLAFYISTRAAYSLITD